MRYKTASLIQLLLILTICTATIGVRTNVAYAQTTRINVDPVVNTAEPGNQVFVNVNITGVLDPGVNLWQVTLKYDMSILRIEDPNFNIFEGPFLSDWGPTFFHYSVSPLETTVYCFFTMQGLEATGDGLLFSILFRVMEPGSTSINIVDTILKDADGGDISHDVANATFYTDTPKADFIVSYKDSTLRNPLVGESITFNATLGVEWGRGSYDPNPSGEITSYVWDFGDGSVETYTKDVNFTASTVHAYSLKGDYRVVLTVYDNSVPSLTDSTDEFLLIAERDLAITDLRIIPEVAMSGSMVFIDVTVTNFGNEAEYFNVSLHYDGTLIWYNVAEGESDFCLPFEYWPSYALLPSDSLTVTFGWDTTGLAEADYIITANVNILVSAVQFNRFFEGIESNYDNNIQQKNATITSGPPPPPSVYTRTYIPNQWITNGNAMGWHADDNSWSYTLPFDFPFYGAYWRTIFISSNGLITFRGGDSSYYNSIEELAEKLAISPAWDDWVTYDPYDIYIWQPQSNHIAIRWYARWISGDNVANFEVVLSRDGVIQFNYGYCDGGFSATVGISNGIDQILAEDVTTTNYINSIVFTPFKPEHDLEVLLEAPSYLRVGQSTALAVAVNNLGTNNETNVELQLLINDATVDSVVIPELLAGASYSFSYDLTPAAEGSYNITAYVPPILGETVTLNNIANKTIYAIIIESAFREDFSTETLDPHWQIWNYGMRAPSPPEATYQQETRYSLTDAPGSLRYYLGSFTTWTQNEPIWGGSGSPYWYYPSMHLHRMFEGTRWILDTKMTYSAPYANAPISVTYVFFGDPPSQGWNNAIVIIGAAWDNYHQAYMIENGTWRILASLPINQYFDTFFYRIIRSDHQFTLQVSRDGISYDTAFTETMGSQIDGLPQGIGIAGQAFWSDTSSYTEYDYVQVAPPPEHDLAVSLVAPTYALFGRSTLLNATVSNQGLNDETDVRLQLLIDGSSVDSVVIPDLPAGSSFTRSYSWTPMTDGDHNITAYVTPVPNEAFMGNNQATRFVSVVHPLIQPIEGQWANYIISWTYGEQLLINATYSEYVTPTQMRVDFWIKSGDNYSYTDWSLLNIMTRRVDYGMWSGFWYPLWIETNVTVGSSVNILDRVGTITGSRFIEVGQYLVDAWELHVPYYTEYVFWFDKANGLVIAAEGRGYYVETWRLVNTNVPLVYLPRLQIQITPESGPAGTQITVTGVNATSSTLIGITWDDVLLQAITADEDGAFTITFAAPPCPRGTHTITAFDYSTNITDTATFTLVPSISMTPISGPMGKKVQVTGFGFGANELITLSFDDMFIGPVASDSTGSFSFAFNIPLSEAGPHVVKALYGNNYVQTTFLVMAMSPLDVNVDTGDVYFKGETVEFYVQTALNGKPVDVTSMNATLYLADGTVLGLTYEKVSTGLYKIRYAITGKGAMTGTYTISVVSCCTTDTIDAYGTSIKTFIVKPTWERETTRMAALSVASIAVVSGMILIWRREKKQLF